MKIDRSNISTSDVEVGEKFIIETFIENVCLLYDNDRKDIFRHIMYYNHKYNMLEFISLFNAFCAKQGVR